MRGWLLAALLATACDRSVSRADGAAPAVTGVHVEASTGAGSTGDLPRLDLGPEPAADSSGWAAETSTGDYPAAPTTTGASTGTSGELVTGTITDETVGSSGDGSTSTGMGDPASVCGDGVCDPAEYAGGCYQGPGWCFQDCWKAPECVSDCPCTPGAAATKNFCNPDPPVVCSATAPGGICDPDGDGSLADADGTAGFYSWAAKCG